MSVPVINAGCACETDNGLWFVHYVVRILMFYDLKEGKIYVIVETDGKCENGEFEFELE